MSIELYDENIEFDLLDMINIQQVSDIINASVSDSTSCIGYYSRVIIEDEKIKSYIPEMNLGEELIDGSLSRENLLCTNFEFLHNLLSSHKAFLLSRWIKDKFIFLTPTRGTRENIQLIWGEGYGKSEDNSGNYSKWFISRTSNTGEIYIVNNGNCSKNIGIKFNLWSINPRANVNISFIDKSIDVRFGEGWKNIEFEEKIPCGISKIKIEYDGNALALNNGDIRELKFIIAGLEIRDITDVDNTETYSGETLYESDQNINFYKYMMPESYIRTILHSTGFFEIESYHLKNGFIKKHLVSRFLVNDSVYHYIERVNESIEDEMMLFICKRKGSLNKKNG